ncbi:GerAB/ArcD/ProY family transporter [Desulfitobacterium sp. THU1]
MQRLSTHQFTMLTAGVLLGTTFMVSGSIVTQAAGRDGWMAVMPAFLMCVPFTWMIFSLVPKYPNQDLVKISEKVLGKWLGKALGLSFSLIMIYFGGLFASQGVDMYNRTVLPLIPHYVLILGVSLITFYLYLSGIEVLARFAEVIFPLVCMALLFIAIFIIPRFERGELFPILQNGITPVLSAALNISPWPFEYVLFLAGLLPFLPAKPKDLKIIKVNFFKALALIIVLSTIVVLVQIMTFGPFETARLTYGLLVLGNMVEISRTIAGIEAVFTLFWTGALTLKAAAFFFAGIWGLQSVFGFKGKKSAIIVGIIFVLIPLLGGKGVNVVVEMAYIDRYIILPFAVLWILLVWGVDLWKHRQKSL